MWRRREVLGLVGAAILPARALRAAAPLILTARPGTAQLAPSDMPATAVWAYADTVPGPVLRVKQGERLRVRFENRLEQPSTIHWHGVRIDNAMDGVPELTQRVVAPGADFDYDFVAPDAGTYWYHPHNRTWEQLARGLYGALIVEEPEPPAVDRDLPLLLDDWRLTDNAAIDEASFGSMHDHAHAGRIGNWITVNGDGEATIPVQLGERLRLRLCNAANARVFELALKGLDGWLMALDGQPVPPQVIPDRLILAPAQRADLIVDVADGATEAVLAFVERDVAYAAVQFPVAGRVRDGRLPAPQPLAANPVSLPGPLADAEPVDLVMEGGAMGGLAAAVYRRREYPIQELVRRGQAWALNGVAGMPEQPLVRVARGRTVRLRMVNDTAWPHAMHLHGHHFQSVSADTAAGPLRDTLLVQRDETAEIAFVADNPGRWLLHCHMVEHAAAGMMTWIEVT